jgi:hypothetical protein
MRYRGRFAAEIVEGLGEVETQNGIARILARELTEQRQRRGRARRLADRQCPRDSPRCVPILGRNAR